MSKLSQVNIMVYGECGMLRTSSHTLATERGRYSRQKVQICDRTCNVCGILEDETHFLIYCSLYKREREVLFSNVLKFNLGFSDMSDENKFVFLLGNTQQVLTWVGKFIYKSIKIRSEELLLTERWPYYHAQGMLLLWHSLRCIYSPVCSYI